jgi:acyl carrier protein
VDDKELREVVRGLIADVLKHKKAKATIDDVKEGVSLTTTLGVDSLDLLQISATVEKKYKMRIPEEELKKMDELGGILKVVKAHLPQGA